MRGRPAKPMRPRFPVKADRLPFGPLYEELKANGLFTRQQVADFYGVSRTIVSKWERRGLRTFSADRCAVKLKVLPYVVWGDAFFAESLMALEGGVRKQLRGFTDDDVRSIRARYDAGEQVYVIARDFPDVHYENVRQVAHRASYRRVA